MALVRPVLMKRRWPFSWAFVRARLVLSGTLNGCGVSSVPSMSKNKIFLLFIRSPLKWDFFFVVTVINAMSGDGFCDYIFGRIQCADTDAVEFYFAFHGDHQAFAAVDDPGFYQVCAVRCYVDYHIRSFDLEFSGVGDIGCYQGRFFACGKFVLFIKVLEFFVFYAAFFEEAFYLGFGEDYWFRFVFLGFDEVVKFFVDLKDGIVGAVIAEGFFNQSVE